MRRLSLAVLTGLALALPGPASADWRRSRPAPAPEPTPPNLPATDRGSVEPTPAGLPGTPAADLPPIYFPEPHYRLLREADAQCLAVRFAWLANLLDKEREQMAKAHPLPSGCKACFGARATAAGNSAVASSITPPSMTATARPGRRCRSTSRRRSWRRKSRCCNPAMTTSPGPSKRVRSCRKRAFACRPTPEHCGGSCSIPRRT